MQSRAPAEPKPNASHAQPCITLPPPSHPARVPSGPAQSQERQFFLPWVQVSGLLALASKVLHTGDPAQLAAGRVLVYPAHSI